MAPFAEPAAASVPSTPTHKRSATAIIRSIVSPSKSAQRQTPSASTAESNPLNSYMASPNGTPQLFALETSAASSFLPPLSLDPPAAPFAAEEKQGRMHKKSLSSVSLASFKSKRGTESTPSSPRPSGSIDFSTLRDLVQPNRGDPTSPQKSPKKPNKSKSIIDISILRGMHRDKREVQPLFKNDKENQSPLRSTPGPDMPSSSGSITNSRPSEGVQGPPMFRMPFDQSQGGSDLCLRPAPPSPSPSNSAVLPPPPPRGRRSVESSRSLQRAPDGMGEHLRRYNAAENSSSNQRSFFGCTSPKAGEAKGSNSHREQKPRPKSMFLPEATSTGSGFSVAPPRNVEPKRSHDNKRVQDSPAKAKGSPAGSLTGAKAGVPTGLDLEGIDVAYEALLDARGVPDNMREKMRGLDVRVKQEFIQKERQLANAETSSTHSTNSTSSALAIFGKRPRTAGEKDNRPKSKGDEKAHDMSGSPKKTRPRSKTFGRSKDKSEPLGPLSISLIPNSNTKRPKSREQGFKGNLLTPASTSAVADHGPRSPTTVPTFTTDEWMEWLQEAARRRNFGNKMFVEGVHERVVDLEVGMKDVQLGVLHKLRLVLRNETLRWVEEFLTRGGLDKLWQVTERVLLVEWREEHEDLILHELLLCMKAVCTAQLGLKKLAEMEAIILPRLLDLLFDEDKKGPAEFTTRGVIISLVNAHLAAVPPAQRHLRTRRVLGYLVDPAPKTQPLDFIEAAHQYRPYRRWCKELTNVTKEVFWIFLHGSNIIPLLPASSNSLSYCERNFPQERPPVPAAPYMGGVEWEATSYLAAHLDLLNACMASLAGRDERNDLRTELRDSGWERLMGGALRTCKEKLHSHVHDCLKTWVRAAAEDEWYVGDVRFGPRGDVRAPSPTKAKKKTDEAPPKLELGLGLGLEVELARRRASGGLSDAWEY